MIREYVSLHEYVNIDKDDLQLLMTDVSEFSKAVLGAFYPKLGSLAPILIKPLPLGNG